MQQQEEQKISIEDFYVIIGELYWNLKQANQALRLVLQSKREIEKKLKDTKK